MRKFGSVFRKTLVIALLLGFGLGAVRSQNSRAAFGIGFASPGLVVAGCVLLGLGLTSTIVGISTENPRANVNGKDILGVSLTVLAVIVGGILLPSDPNGHFEFPTPDQAPAGITDAEWSAYIAEKPVLESLAQDVRAELAREIPTKEAWTKMSEAEKKGFLDRKTELSAELWKKYGDEGLVSEGSLKALAALTRR